MVDTKEKKEKEEAENEVEEDLEEVEEQEDDEEGEEVEKEEEMRKRGGEGGRGSEGVTGGGTRETRIDLHLSTSPTQQQTDSGATFSAGSPLTDRLDSQAGSRLRPSSTRRSGGVSGALRWPLGQSGRLLDTAE